LHDRSRPGWRTRITLRQAEAHGQAVRRAIGLLVFRIGTARHLSRHGRQRLAVHAAIAGFCRRHEGSHHRGRDEQGQDKDVGKKPKPHGVSSAMPARAAKGQELRRFDLEQANRCFVISLPARHEAQDLGVPVAVMPSSPCQSDQGQRRQRPAEQAVQQRSTKARMENATLPVHRTGGRATESDVNAGRKPTMPLDKLSGDGRPSMQRREDAPNGSAGSPRLSEPRQCAAPARCSGPAPITPKD
jgi:hypothetical protein